MSTRWWLPELPSLGARSPSSAVRQAAEAPTGDSVPVLHCWPVTVPTEGSSGHQLRANFPDGSHVILKVPEGVQAGETLQCAVRRLHCVAAVLPADVEPGERLAVAAADLHARFDAPPNAHPGMVIQVAPPGASTQQRVLRIAVPDGCESGQTLAVETGRLADGTPRPLLGTPFDRQRLSLTLLGTPRQPSHPGTSMRQHLGRRSRNRPRAAVVAVQTAAARAGASPSCSSRSSSTRRRHPRWPSARRRAAPRSRSRRRRAAAPRTPRMRTCRAARLQGRAAPPRCPFTRHSGNPAAWRRRRRRVAMERQAAAAAEARAQAAREAARLAEVEAARACAVRHARST